MWTYIAGPFLSLLPNTWRKKLPFSESINWPQAVTISGFAEFVVAVVGLVYWYSISMTTWVSRGLDVALNGNAGSGITDQAIGAMAWFMWANHPLTWILGYFSVEGAVRLCGAAFSESLLGTLPLFLVDRAVRLFNGESKAAKEAPAAASSFFESISEKVMASSNPASPDEITLQRSGTEEFLQICASRRKPDWDPPRVIRYGEAYYRLEDSAKCVGVRPFRYTLRRLPAGVPGRNVLVYEPKL